MDKLNPSQTVKSDRHRVRSWIYITDEGNTTRYALGQWGNRMLSFVGVNPSTARPDDLDNTINRVKSFASYYGYDGWLMLNVYPQRSTNPQNMHAVLDQQIHEENLRQIKKLIGSAVLLDFCAAWGTEITRRPFLTNCLNDLSRITGDGVNWYRLHELTKDGHPRHPLYLPANAQINDFDINTYLKNLTPSM